MSTTSPPTANRAAVVYNPTKVDLEELRRAVAEAERTAGWAQTVWCETAEVDAGQAATRQVLNEGATVVIAAGGDGTARAVAHALRDSGIPLALLPSGTGNLLARNLGMNLGNLKESIAAAFTGVDRRIDMGIAEIVRPDGGTEEHVFLVMAGVGLDAKLIARTSSKLKKAVGWLAYVDATVRSLPELTPIRLHYRLDFDGPRLLNTHSLIIGNCGALPGGILLIPDAKPDDGILDIAALRPRGPFGWLKVWNKITWENGVLRKSAAGRKIIDLTADVKDVTYFRGKDLAVTLHGAQAFQLDGDEFGAVTSVHAWVDPGALTLKMPA